ncbi:MAG TPA: DotU family type IV/VI secretion system protein, partial [Polyangia bacterium]
DPRQTLRVAMELLTDLSRECFSAIACLRDLEEPVAFPGSVRDRLCACIDTFQERSRRGGTPDRDVQDASYALVALMDEVAMAAPEPLRGYWMSNLLQFHYFGESAAGEGFFTRLDCLLVDGRRLGALGVYHLCLLFGFQGKYAFPGGEAELLRISDGVRNQVQEISEAPDLLSPAGEAPDEPLVRAASRNLLLWSSLGILALALAVFVGLRLSFDHQVAELGTRVDEIAP